MSDELHAFLSDKKHTDARVVEHLVAFGESGNIDDLDAATALLSQPIDKPDYWDVFGNVSHLTGRAIDSVLEGNYTETLDVIETLRERSGTPKKTAAKKTSAPRAKKTAAKQAEVVESEPKAEATVTKQAEVNKPKAESKPEQMVEPESQQHSETVETVVESPSESVAVPPLTESMPAPAPGVPPEQEEFVNTELLGDLGDISQSFGTSSY